MPSSAALPAASYVASRPKFRRRKGIAITSSSVVLPVVVLTPNARIGVSRTTFCMYQEATLRLSINRLLRGFSSKFSSRESKNSISSRIVLLHKPPHRPWCRPRTVLLPRRRHGSVVHTTASIVVPWFFNSAGSLEVTHGSSSQHSAPSFSPRKLNYYLPKNSKSSWMDFLQLSQ